VYDLLLAQIPAEPTSLLVLPHFTPTGTPYFDVSPVSAILGLSLSTHRGQFIKALLEGVTYEMRLNLDILAEAGVPVGELCAIGGGAKSEAWMQIKADIMGVPIVSLNVSEAACLGAALLAAVGSGAIASIPAATTEWVHPRRVFDPAPANAMRYSERYSVYRRLYDTLKPIGQELNRLT